MVPDLEVDHDGRRPVPAILLDQGDKPVLSVHAPGAGIPVYGIFDDVDGADGVQIKVFPDESNSGGHDSALSNGMNFDSFCPHLSALGSSE
jgi:hypothetical protein